MNRRSFLGAILAAACAPAIVRADALMRVVPRETSVLVGFDLAARGDEVALVFGEVGRYDGIIIHLREPQRLRNEVMAELLRQVEALPPRFVVPAGVSTVRATMIGGGGGGGRG